MVRVAGRVDVGKVYTDVIVPCVQGPTPCSVNVTNTFVESVRELCGTLVVCGLAVISNPYREHPTSSFHGPLGYWWQWGAYWRSGWRQCRTLWGKGLQQFRRVVTWCGCPGRSTCFPGLHHCYLVHKRLQPWEG